MRRALRSAVVASLAFSVLAGAAARAPAAPLVQPDDAEGPLIGAWLEVFYPEERAPRNARFWLVESGAGPGARRFPIPRRRYYEDDSTLAGRVVGRLSPDTAYDVVIAVPGHGRTVLPAAFTARAPRFGSIAGTTAARGEVAYVELEFALPGTRFRLGGRAARLAAHVPGDTWYGIAVPETLPREISASRVTAEASRVSVTSEESLTLVPERRTLTALVDGTRRPCTGQEWIELAGRVVVQGSREVASPARQASQGYVISLPASFSELTAPVTFTEADGASVETFNVRDRGAPLAGAVGVFRSTTCTVTVDEIVGNRLRGTFSAHTVDQGWLDREPDGREIEVTLGRFEVDPGRRTE